MGRIDARKTQLLERMGITVWYGRRSSTDPLPLPVNSEPLDGPAEDQVQAATVKEEVKTEDPANLQPLHFVCFAIDGAVLVALAPEGERELRFAQDIVCAASGTWSQAPSKLNFDWPQRIGGRVVSGDRTRAVCAFVEKQLQNVKGTVVLVTDDLAQNVQSLSDRSQIVVLPPLKQLAGDIDAKKRLWLQIQKTR
ncbi:MAG: hypothetical protein O3A63_19515 [Proteobacteria bacterium]|nr:hypothetical protein [Pseudomonadota bacterium]